MLKKNKKFTLLLSGLTGVLIASSAAGVALSSCSTTSTTSSDVQYSYVIDWNNKDAVERLIIDNDGLVYSDNAKTTLIAISPKVKLTTVKIPSRVKSIMGYSKVMYRENSSQTLVDQIPSGQSESSYTKVYQSVGAFQDMVSLETVVLESGSQLKSIGGIAFSGCTTLKSISGLSNSLDYIGTSAFTNCINLASIDTTNVIKVGDNAFSGCSSLGSVDLSNVIYVGNNAFANCSSLTSIGSLEKASSIGVSAFLGAIKSGSNISLKLTNLIQIPHSAFAGAQGISKIDLSGNTLLTTIGHDAFANSSITEIDLTGCSKLSTIEYNAFKNSTSLTTVSLPSNDATSLRTIGSNAFANCANLTTVAAKGSSGFVATNKLSTIGANFLANTAITSVDLSKFIVNNSQTDSQEVIPFGSETSLAYITNLTTVVLPSNLEVLNAGLFYRSGVGANAGFSLDLPSTIKSIVYKANLIINDPNNNDSTTTITHATPFRNSGLKSIDMSKITSYQESTDNQTKIPSYLFFNLSKLESVILKNETTEIGQSVFQGTRSLMLVAYPATSDAETIAETTNGFTASSTLQIIGQDAFNGAFSETSDATLDLRQMTFSNNTTPAAFNHSKIATLKLPTTITTIAANSFDNTTKLKAVNFDELTSLTTIFMSNFTNTQLTSIDLSKTQFATITPSNVGGTGKLFTNLPNNCVVSLPNTLDNFSGVFLDSSDQPVTFSYPNGLKIQDGFAGVSSGVLTFGNGNSVPLNNINSINLSSNNTVYSIGQNTFFSNSKLNSVTLRATGISNRNIFTAAPGITTNSNNTISSSSYVKDKVPFGNNESLTSLNYTNFTSTNTIVAESNVRAGESNDAQTSLFNTTNSTTWSEVAKIINSLSYQTYTIDNNGNSSNVSTLKSNMSSWSSATSGISDPINTDSVATWTAASSGSSTNTPASIKITNSYPNNTASDFANGVTISASDSTKTIIHNGVTWAYSNDGSTIKLTGKVNMYKATNGSNHYLVFFNQTTYSTTGTPNTIYYVPGSTPVNVTLTIAAKTTSTTK